ncbi:MAG: cytochrome c [Pseudomonadales bacterium]|nr:cytochrome c [Pseudomonadales bacterium]
MMKHKSALGRYIRCLFSLIVILDVMFFVTACSTTKTNEGGCEPGSTDLLSEKIVHTYGALGTGNADYGKKLFASLCANCHTDQGVQSINKSIKSSLTQPTPPRLACQFKQNLSEAYLFATIKHGKKMDVSAHAMPAWKGILADVEILDLVSYILSLAKEAE